MTFQRRQQLALFFLSLFTAAIAAPVICTVGGEDYASIQAALDGCNGGVGSIVLQVAANQPTGDTAVYEETLVFPTTLSNVVLEPLAGNVTLVTLTGAGHYVDPSSWLSLVFRNVSFNGDGSPQMLFSPKLTNTNVTLQNCFVSNFVGDHVLWAESCVSSSQWFIDNTQWIDVPANALRLEAMETIVLTNSYCRRCPGQPDVAHGGVFYFSTHEISRGTFIINGNAQWSLWDGQDYRCRYYLDSDAYTRCTQVGTDSTDQPIMQMQCYDEQATEDDAFCTIGSTTIEATSVGGVDVSVVNKRLPYCRTYRACRCNEVLFRPNSTLSSVPVTLPMGDLLYGDAGNPYVVPCIAGADVALNTTFGYQCTEVYNGYSETEVDCSSAYSNNAQSVSGTINDTCSCPRNRSRSDDDLRDPDAFPCRYTPAEGMLCREQELGCCAEPFLASDTAHYYLQACSSAASLSGTMEVVLRYNAYQMYITYYPTYTSSSYRLITEVFDGTMWYTPLVQVLPANAGKQPLTLYGLTNNSASIEMDNGGGALVGDFLEMDFTFFENERVVLRINGFFDDAYGYEVWTNARGTLQDSVVFVGGTDSSCVIHESVTPPRFFEAVFHYGCNGELSSSTCRLLRDCAVINDDGTVEECTQYDCSAPFSPTMGMTLSSTALLNGACSTTVTAVGTPILYDGGWVFRVESLETDLMDTASFARWQTLGSAGLPIYYGGAGLLGCSDTGLFYECTCSSQNATALDIYWPSASYVCDSDEQAFCSCDSRVIASLYAASNNTVAYYIAHLADTLSNVQIIDNRAQQIGVGMLLDRVSYELISDFSIALPLPRDNQSLPREVARNDNEFLQGTLHDIVHYPPPPPVRFVGDTLDLSCQAWCDDLCPQVLVDPEEFACIVDKEATEDMPGFGITVFENITDALERTKVGGGCRTDHPVLGRIKTLNVRFSEQYYDETVVIADDANDLFVASFDNALISGSAHTLDGRANTVTLRGLDFIHALENKRAFFNIINGDLKRFHVSNCRFFGEQVRSGGLTEGRRVDKYELYYNSFENNEAYAVRLLNTKQVYFQHNSIVNCVGRCLYLEFLESARVDHNLFYNVRGGADFKEAAIVTLRARNALACRNSEASTIDLGVVTINVPARRHRCSLSHNVQHVDVFAEDFRDQCFWIDRGYWNAVDMLRNTCLKAQYGITLTNVPLWSTSGSQSASDTQGGTLEWYSINNPQTRPTLFRADSDRYVGYDYRLRGAAPQASTSGSSTYFFRSYNKDTRNFADLAARLAARPTPQSYEFEINALWFADVLQCEVNNNYDDCSMRWDFGPPLAAHGFTRVYPQHGVRFCFFAAIWARIEKWGFWGFWWFGRRNSVALEGQRNYYCLYREQF
jgi:hypothetical protein